jgi:hypothetical protein
VSKQKNATFLTEMLHFRHETCGFSLLNHVSANKNTFPFLAAFSKVRSYQKNDGRKTGNNNHEKSVLEKI